MSLAYSRSELSFLYLFSHRHLTPDYRRRKNLAVLAAPFADAVAAMCQGVVSINLICLDEPDQEGEEPKLLMRK